MKTFNIEIEKTQYSEKTLNEDFTKTIEEALLMTLLEKELLSQKQFELCQQRFQEKNKNNTNQIESKNNNI